MSVTTKIYYFTPQVVLKIKACIMFGDIWTGIIAEYRGVAAKRMANYESCQAGEKSRAQIPFLESDLEHGLGLAGIAQIAFQQKIVPDVDSSGNGICMKIRTQVPLDGFRRCFFY